MKHLLIVFHSKTGNTRQLADAVIAGATSADVGDVEVRVLRAADAGPEDLLWSDGLLLGTPENFGYLSGALKDFLDRTFYEVEWLTPRPAMLLAQAMTAPALLGPWSASPMATRSSRSRLP